MRIQVITIVSLAVAVFLSGCSSTSHDSGFYRGIDVGVKTSRGAFAARYNSWRTSIAESADQTEIGAGVIAPMDFPGGWRLERRSSLGSNGIMVMVMDSEYKEQQRFVAKSGSVHLLKTLQSPPLLLADDWQPQPMFDTQPPGSPGGNSIRVYTKNLLESSPH